MGDVGSVLLLGFLAIVIVVVIAYGIDFKDRSDNKKADEHRKKMKNGEM